MQAPEAGLSSVRAPSWPFTLGLARTLELSHPSATEYRSARLDSRHLRLRPTGRKPSASRNFLMATAERYISFGGNGMLSVKSVG